jgi:putative methyltransferase (TIGR04325 family)
VRFFLRVVPRSLRPPLRRLAQRLFRSRRWELAPDGWATAQRGWDVASIAAVQKERWPNFVGAIAGTAPLTIPREHDRGHLVTLGSHNAAMSFAYAVTAAAREKTALRILDWGGGVGHYALLARAAVPGVAMDYVIYDMPQICEAGKKLFDDVTFTSDRREALRGTYDLIVASSSLWYERDWESAIGALAEACAGFLFITRMGIVRQVPSFVTIQRPVDARYDTEYLCWILNERELVSRVCSNGMTLVREFLIDYGPTIRNAPEQPVMRGYLFRQSDEPGRAVR